jgi:hypothetical protein
MFSSIAARIARASFRNETESLGATVGFSKIPAGWFPLFVRGSLTRVWRGAGLPLRGCGIFTIGLPTRDGVSGRFCPESALYQGWFGAYLFTAPPSFTNIDEKTPNFSNLAKIAIADQNNWLRWYGDPASGATLVPGSDRLLAKAKRASGYDLLLEAKIKTHSDVGPGNGALLPKIFASVVRDMFRQEKEGSSVPDNFLSPPIGGTDYGTIALQGYTLLARDAERKVTALAFASVTEKAFPEVREELRKAILSLRITPLKMKKD